MPNNVDGVIAALRIAQEEAEKGHANLWKTRAANRWVDQLPGARMGRWLHLRLRAGLFEEGEVDRNEFIGHVKATIAYLEANREAIQSVRFWPWPFKGRARHRSPEPIDADFAEITDASDKGQKSSSKPMRLIKR